MVAFLLSKILCSYLLTAFLRSVVFEKQREGNLQTSVNCDVISHSNGAKFLQLGKLGTNFGLSKKLFTSVQKCKLKKLTLSITS